MRMNNNEIGLVMLRLGIASMFLWFGFSQLVNSMSWVGWVPDWAVAVLHISPAMIVLLNGCVEVALGTLLACNIFVRYVALLLGLHLALITFEIGLSAIGVRDFGLTLATLSLYFFYTPQKTTQTTSSDTLLIK